MRSSRSSIRASRVLSLFLLVALVLSLLAQAVPASATPILVAAPDRTDRAVARSVPPRDFVPEPLQRNREEQTATAAPAEPSTSARAPQTMPLVFQANVGQVDPQVQFTAATEGGRVFFTPSSLVFSLPSSGMARQANQPRALSSKQQDRSKANRTATSLTVSFVGASSSAVLTGGAKSGVAVTMIKGRDAASQPQHIPSHNSVVYKGLYPGIDARYDGLDGNLKSTFTVAPGRLPQVIAWQYTGASKLSIDAGSGDLHIAIPAASGVKDAQAQTLVERAPIAWQDINGSRVPVTVAFELGENMTVRFKTGQYNPQYPLIIDPTMEYLTTVGGNNLETPRAIVVGADGTTYVAGWTFSSNFPGTSGRDLRRFDYDVVVFALSADGSNLVAATYIGGSKDDYGEALALGQDGALYLAGSTDSWDFPVTVGPDFVGGRCYYWSVCLDAFVIKLNGVAPVYSRLIAGLSDDEASGIAAFADGRVVIVGDTTSSDLPTPGGFQAAFNGTICYKDNYGTIPCADAFIMMISADGTSVNFGSYYGGGQGDALTSVAIAPDGSVVAAGYTESTDLVTFNAYDATPGGDDGQAVASDGLVLKLDAASLQPAFSTFVGGTGADSAADIAVDAYGNAVVVGSTTASDFYTVNAYDESCGMDGACDPTTTYWGGSEKQGDSFIVKYDPSGVPLFSTYVGGSGDDLPASVEVDNRNNLYIAGTTESLNWPTASPVSVGEGAFDIFVAKFTEDGAGLLFSTTFGDTDSEYAADLAIDGNGFAFVTGSTSRTAPLSSATEIGQQSGGEIFVAKLEANVTELRDDTSSPPEICPCEAGNEEVGDPINTRSGNLWLTVNDLLLGGSGPRLEWIRSYAHQRTEVLTGALGAGWQHSYGMRVIRSTDPHGVYGHTLIVSPKGNVFRYTNKSDGSFTPYPGLNSTLRFDATNNIYVQTYVDDSVIVYNERGRAEYVLDSQGRRVTLAYDANDRLSTITDAANPRRFFELVYVGTTRHLDKVIARYNDTQRSIDYLIGGNGDLARFADTRGFATHYSYRNHLITKIENDTREVLSETGYDSYTPGGKASWQVLRDGTRLDLAYENGATTVTTTGRDGSKTVDVYRYSATNMLTSHDRNGSLVRSYVFDEGYAPTHVSNPAGVEFTAVVNAQSKPVTVTNATGGITSYTYDPSGNLASTTNQDGVKTVYTYDDRGNLTHVVEHITANNPAGETTTLHYTADNYVDYEQSKTGVVTRYTYTPGVPGQLETITEHSGTAKQTTTKFGYSTYGWIESITSNFGTPIARTDRVMTDERGRLIGTIANFENGTFESGKPDQDLIVRYGYDHEGRRVWMQDHTGSYTVNHYNATGLVDWISTNYTGTLGADPQRPVLPDQPPAFDPAFPDRNIVQRFGYDDLGRMTDKTINGILTGSFDPVAKRFATATERTTHTIYDDQHRPVKEIQNYKPGLPINDPKRPDVNVQREVRFDEKGRVAAEIDPYGRWTVYEYDQLSRPVKTTTNYENGDALSVDDKNKAWTDGSDTDIVSFTQYRSDGLVDYAVENFVNGTWNPDEPDLDRITSYTYDERGRGETTRDPAGRVTTVRYGVDDRVEATQDALGRWMRFIYNAEGRVDRTIANCRTSDNVPSPTACDAFTTDRPDRNVPTITLYNEYGRAVGTQNAHGKRTNNEFDAFGRTTVSTINYENGEWHPDEPDVDLSRVIEYNRRGQPERMTDEAGRVTVYGYDALGRRVSEAIADATARVGYDGQGSARWSETASGVLTVFLHDQLGRTVATVAGYQNGIAEAGEAVDRDVISRAEFDLAGRTTAIISAINDRTEYGYDLRDRLVKVTANVVASGCAKAPCNVETRYGYDRRGLRTSMTDARANKRFWHYDAAGNVKSEVDGLSRVTTYEYDEADRVRMKRDPRGTEWDTSYVYDGMDYLTEIRSSKLNAPILMVYNALGQRRFLTDETGTTEFVYDGAARVKEVIAPHTGKVSYTYNQRGDRTGITYPNNLSLTYGYRPDGQLETVSQGTTTLARYGFDDRGRMSSLTRANGTITSYHYDNLDRMDGVQTLDGSDVLTQFNYALNRSGQRIGITEVKALVSVVASACPVGRSCIYMPLITTGSTAGTKALAALPGVQTRQLELRYDGLQRLEYVVADDAPTERYGYDLAGNRTGVWLGDQQIAQLTFDAANQRDATATAPSMYDAAGNIRQDGANSYTYDALNRLQTFHRNGVTSTATYNGDGTLVKQASASVSTLLTQDLAGSLPQVLATIESGKTTSVVYGGDRPLLTLDTAPSWLSPDAQSSARQRVDSSGAVTATMDYTAWGEAKAAQDGVGYTGEWQSGDMVYLRARWYAPETGRFLSRDPATGTTANPATFDQYSYAENDPINGSDPTGMFRCVDGGGQGYAEFCMERRDLLLTMPLMSQAARKENSLRSLVYMMQSQLYPGGNTTVPMRHRQSDMTRSAERLDWILAITATGDTQFSRLFSDPDALLTLSNDKGISGESTTFPFIDSGFDAKFQDGHLFNGYSGNQVGHFLTAVRMGIKPMYMDALTVPCMVGHELLPDHAINAPKIGDVHNYAQCLIGTNNVFTTAFSAAVNADLNGQYGKRDCIVSFMVQVPDNWHYMHVENQEDPNNTPGAAQLAYDRKGNSRQDMRLTIKGFIFGRAISMGELASLDAAANWLTANLAAGRRN